MTDVLAYPTTAQADDVTCQPSDAALDAVAALLLAIVDADDATIEETEGRD